MRVSAGIAPAFPRTGVDDLATVPARRERAEGSLRAGVGMARLKVTEFPDGFVDPAVIRCDAKLWDKAEEA
ncbi:hypothetical protein GCM10027074_04860 [Streptomyces deserti]